MFKIREAKVILKELKNELFSQENYSAKKFPISNHEIIIFVKSNFCLPSLLTLKIITCQRKVSAGAKGNE